MGKDVVVILGESSFMDFAHLRQSLIRIPEVAEVLTAAQNHWDTLRGVKNLDLNNSFYNPDEYFMIHPEYKNFLSELVQFALIQRLKNQGFCVEYIYSNINASRVHLLTLKLQTLKEFVFKHPAVRSFNSEPKVIRSLYAVHTEPKYALYRLTSCGIKNIKTSAQASEVFDKIENLGEASKILNIGLGQSFKFLKSLKPKQSQQILDSIILDTRLKPIFETHLNFENLIELKH